MNKTKIDWADYSWNPVIGCKNGCWYCYANRWAKRAGQSFEPHWSKGQERKPYKIKEPSKIFVCSLADLFGDWIPNEWIEKVLEIVKDNPRHTYQFLTKNPKRYLEFEFPKNCWLGVTAEKGDYEEVSRISILKTKRDNFKFVSVEPLLGEFSPSVFGGKGIDLIIVGAMTGMGEKNVVPKKEWIESIKHPNILYKDNIKEFLPKNLNIT